MQGSGNETATRLEAVRVPRRVVTGETGEAVERGGTGPTYTMQDREYRLEPKTDKQNGTQKETPGQGKKAKQHINYLWQTKLFLHVFVVQMVGGGGCAFPDHQDHTTETTKADVMHPTGMLSCYTDI